MNPATILRRAALPAVSLLLVAAVLLQVRATQQGARSVALAAPLPEGGRIAAEGRLVAYPGADVVLAFDLAGTVRHLPVGEGDRVRRGQLLAELDNDDLEASLAQAKARVRETQADQRLFEAEVARAEGLFERGTGTAQAVDRARRDLEASLARAETGAAEVRRIEAVIGKTRIVAPLDGVVLERFIEPGESVDAGTRTLRVADTARVRVEAEVNEFDAGRVRVGAVARVVAEGWPGQAWSGRVEEIPGAVVARQVKPEDPGRPVDTRVLLVKIALDGPTPLKLGQRVEVEIVSEPAGAPAAAAAPATSGAR